MQDTNILPAPRVRTLISSCSSCLAAATKQCRTFRKILSRLVTQSGGFASITNHLHKIKNFQGGDELRAVTKQAIIECKLVKRLVQLQQKLVHLSPENTTETPATGLQVLVDLHNLLGSLLWWMIGAIDPQDFNTSGRQPMLSCFKEAVACGLFEVLFQFSEVLPPAFVQVHKGFNQMPCLTCLIVMATLKPCPGFGATLPQLMNSNYMTEAAKILLQCAQQPDYLEPAADETLKHTFVESFTHVLSFICHQYCQTQHPEGQDNPALTSYVSKLLNDPSIMQVLHAVISSILHLGTNAWPSPDPAGTTMPFNFACILSSTSLTGEDHGKGISPTEISSNPFLSSWAAERNCNSGSREVAPETCVTTGSSAAAGDVGVRTGNNNSSSSNDGDDVAADAGNNHDSSSSNSILGRGAGIMDNSHSSSVPVECSERRRVDHSDPLYTLSPRVALSRALKVLEVLVQVNEQYKGRWEDFDLILRIRSVVGFALAWQPPVVTVRVLPSEDRNEAAAMLAEVLIIQLQRVAPLMQQLATEQLAIAAGSSSSSSGRADGNAASSSSSGRSSSKKSAEGATRRRRKAKSAGTTGGDGSSSSSNTTSSPTTSSANPAAAAQLPNDIADMWDLEKRMYFNDDEPWLDDLAARVLRMTGQLVDNLTGLVSPEQLQLTDSEHAKFVGVKEAVLKTHGPILLPLVESLFRCLPLHKVHYAATLLLISIMRPVCGRDAPDAVTWFGESFERDLEALLITLRKFLNYWFQVAGNMPVFRDGMLHILLLTVAELDKSVLLPLTLPSEDASYQPSGSVRMAGHLVRVMVAVACGPRDGLSVRPMSLHESQLLELANVRPALGCWYSGCLNLNGLSEVDLKLKHCSTCHVARYCCTECQSADWKNGHKHVCEEMAGVTQVDAAAQL